MVKNNDVERAASRAIGFLYQNQLPWGEFRTFSSWNRWLIFPFYDPSVFMTAFVLCSLKGVEDERAGEMTKKATDFLLSEKRKGGIWSFWTSKNKKRIPPDMDDTSIVSLSLKCYHIEIEENIPLIMGHRNKEGLFLTWILEERHKKSFFWRLTRRDFDVIINANVLSYLGESIPEVCRFIKKSLDPKGFSSIYYPSILVLYYVVSRGARRGVSCFQEPREEIIKNILARKRKNGSLGNELETALGLNTLFNFNYSGKEIEEGIAYLIRKQRENGSFRRYVFFYGVPWWFMALNPAYRYYGSEELTTAFCLEAFENYGKQI